MLTKIVSAAVLIITIYSCGNKIEGKIETRENNKIFLVNKSPEKAYKFTVKKTIIVNDTTYDYETDQIELAPGDEKFLGIKSVVSKQLISKPVEDTPHDGRVVKIIFKDSSIGEIPVSRIDEAISHGATFLNPEDAKNYKQIASIFKYEVTGQQELKQKK